ncbi:MAG: RAMP superfamily CRISPR-associated protein [Deltaproteobacteria bacterium]|nr:RAMP superfamily CRISPR-associated protein [Deltaproteobacteria bacterium]
MKAKRIAVARVTLEAVSPLIVGSGRGDAVSDAVCTTDANGVPMIPGTSIAGMLRHQGGKASLSAEDEKSPVKNPFGYQQRDLGARSRIVVHHGYGHDATDRPVSPQPSARRGYDAVLEAMRDGTIRDHVKLTGAGVADEMGKFDERLVPRGARFTFDVLLEEPDVDGGSERSNVEALCAELEAILAPLAHRDAALGGRTRRGFGLVQVVRGKLAGIDLCRAEDRATWEKYIRGEDFGGRDLKLVAAADEERSRGMLEVEPEDFWIFGRGEDILETITDRQGRTRTRRTQMTPKREVVIKWEGSRGVVVDRDLENVRDTRPAVVPGSGVKGALRHRALFHARRRTREWNANRRPDAPTDAELCIDLLFGLEPRSGSREERGLPGRVFVGDVKFVPKEKGQGRLDHVSVDRFTGAPMDGMLFGEEPLYRGRFELSIAVDHRVSQNCPAGDRRLLALALRSLVDALSDLEQGRLALGGGSNRGHGYVKAKCEGLKKAIEAAADKVEGAETEDTR